MAGATAGERPPAPKRPLAGRISNVACGKHVFDADFDSGNCAHVEAGAAPAEYHVWVSPDAAGTPHEVQLKTWFHFSVRGGERASWISITVHNMNAQTKLYKNDHRPVYRAGDSGPWARVRVPVSFRGTKEEDNFEMTFRHRFDSDAEPVHFAFCYPWAYADVQASLRAMDGLFADAPVRGGVYYHRELLARSLEGRRVDLVTVTSTKGMEAGREPHVPGDPVTFPDRGPRPRLFPGKPIFLLSARVHPGETPASHVFNGFAEFILRQDDPRAAALRDRFVFLLVPCLNPDGVARGHYRTDTLGVNLNRCYAAPSPAQHPAIHAVRAVVSQAHAQGRFRFLVDLHGHATKRGCFLFGNHLPDMGDQVDAVLYAKLASLNSQFVEFGGCVFSAKMMSSTDKRDGLSKEGSSRVAIHRLTGATHCYTLECNYNMGRALNRLREPSSGRTSPPLVAHGGSQPPKYTPECWQEVGRALGVALLDMHAANPRSRIAIGRETQEAALAEVRRWCTTHVRGMRKRRPVLGGDDASGSDAGGEEDSAGVRGGDEASANDALGPSRARSMPRVAAARPAAVGRGAVQGATARLATLSLGGKEGGLQADRRHSLPAASARAAPSVPVLAGTRSPGVGPPARRRSGSTPGPMPAVATRLGALRSPSGTFRDVPRAIPHSAERATLGASRVQLPMDCSPGCAHVGGSEAAPVARPLAALRSPASSSDARAGLQPGDERCC